jgi:hypothetical protein
MGSIATSPNSAPAAPFTNSSSSTWTAPPASPVEPAIRSAAHDTSRSLDDCRILELPKIHDPRGNLTFIEGNQHVPFGIERVYYLYDVPGGSDRGGHAHKTLHQFIVAMSGSFDVVLDDGRNKKRVHLSRSYNGLYLCPMIWRELDNFSSGSVCMVLASARYDEGDYFRDYAEFMRARWAKH